MSSTLQDRPTSAIAAQVSRIASVDLIRGAVMILMAVDHVRVYAGLPPGGPTPGIFFTRWVTHFFAPAFIFLASTAPTSTAGGTKTSRAFSSCAAYGLSCLSLRSSGSRGPSTPTSATICWPA